MRTSFDALHEETRPLRQLDPPRPAPGIRPESPAAAWTLLSAALVLIPIALLLLL